MSKEIWSHDLFQKTHESIHEGHTLKKHENMRFSDFLEIPDNAHNSKERQEGKFSSREQAKW